jgi:hypothetical protein
VTRIWRVDGDDYYNCEFILECPEAIQAVKDGAQYVSCAYLPTDKGPEGAKNGVNYDFEVLDGVYLHLAITKNPRYDDAIIVENELDNGDVVTNVAEITEKENRMFGFKKSEVQDDAKFETKRGLLGLAELIAIANEDAPATETPVEPAAKTETVPEVSDVEPTSATKPEADTKEEKVEEKKDDSVVENEDTEGFVKLKKAAVEVPVIENSVEISEESMSAMEARGNKLYSINK